MGYLSFCFLSNYYKPTNNHSLNFKSLTFQLVNIHLSHLSFITLLFPITTKIIPHYLTFILLLKYYCKTVVYKYLSSSQTFQHPPFFILIKHKKQIMDYVNPDAAHQFQKECSYAFKDKELHLIDKPARAQDRQCTDPCCMAVFAILFLAFVVYAAYSIDFMFQNGLITLNPNDQVTFLKGVTQEQFQRLGIIVGACIGGSVLIAIIVLILLKCIPEKMIIAMSFTVVLVIGTVGIYDFVRFQSGVGGYFMTVCLVYMGIVFGFWDNLTKAAILMKTVGNFIVQKPSTLLLIFIALLYCAVVLFLWVAGFYSFCTSYSHNKLSYGGFIVSMIFWVFMLVFFNFYFYYTSVFLTSTSLAIWFYDKQQYDTITTPFKFMVRYHLGTITFASLVITFGKLLKFLLFFARFRDAQNSALAAVGMFMGCVIYCCMGAIEAMIEVVNNYAVITCGLTGFSLMDSAKIIGEFIFNDPQQAFNDFTWTTYFVNWGGILTVSIIPTLVGGILLAGQNGSLWALGVVMIMFTSSMIGLLMLQIFVQSASTLFLLYIMDGKLSDEGLDVVWIDTFANELEKSFDKAFVGKIQKQRIKTRTITTVVIHGNGYVQQFQQQVPVIDNTQINLQPLRPQYTNNQIQVKL